MLSLLLKPTKIVRITSPANNINLYTQSSSPSYPLNIICLISANIGSTNTTPSFSTGSGWKGGSWIYINNSATIRGSTGATGATGSTGANGAGGAGGKGQLNGTNGSAGSPGSAGGTGSTGVTGGEAFQTPNISGVTILLNNGSGTIIGGTGGTGGPGGPGGLGGGGGGGGGGYWV